MRTILFRGKRVDGNGWAEGFYYPEFQDYSIAFILSKDDGIVYEVIPETVGQFTGLTDKNGEDIFEGEIIAYRSCSGKMCICQVEFCNYGFFAGDYPIVHNCKIIGNIYDNPEQLNQ